MSDSTKYNTIIAWRTIAKDVFQLIRETIDNPATYRMIVSVLDNNNSGAGQKAIGYTFTDNIGTPYKIIAVNTTTIDVEDIFRTGYCPISGKEGWIHKSAYKGYSYMLPSSLFWNLHPLAQSNNNKFSMSILWGNDPNARQIPFTNVYQPGIANYRGELTDTDGIVFKPEEDYGQNPQLQVYQLLEDGTYSQVFLGENITRSIVDNKIDSILFSGTGELITGYILIKN